MSAQSLRTVKEVSAGGLVISSSNPSQVALISHRNRGGGRDWVIPKGHVEGSESLEQTAIREVAEETGIKCQIVSKLGEINYSFTVGKKRIKKTVHHFLLQQVGGELSAENDPTGEVLDVQWFEINELDNVLGHANEKLISTKARGLMT
ncbi:MAG: NUDIX hydrolase [Aquiluna sp.]|nr:NUDIX hydrolase [Aquiluna sp.]